MKLYVISDYFYELFKSPEIHYSRWDDYRPRSLGGYDCVMVDLTFETEINKQVIKIRTLFNLMRKLSRKDYLNENNLILIVICGALNEMLEYYERYDNLVENENREPYRFSTYDFLKQLLPVPDQIIDDEEGKHIYPIVMPGLINSYLVEHVSGETYLSYLYDPKNKEFAEVTPLATIKENVNQCVAFECRSGRGLVVILPPYKKDSIENIFTPLIDVCKNYIKRKEFTTETLRVDVSIPEVIRKNFVDALICFKNELYDKSVLSCRKTLEISAISLGANPDDSLIKMLKYLKNEKKIIDDRLYELADLIRVFGNIGAHAAQHEDIEITEEDAINAIDYLKVFFDYVYVIPKRIQDSRLKVDEFNRKGAK